MRVPMPCVRQLAGRTVLLSAAHKALFAEARGTVKAATLHAELIFGLCPTRNIGAALSSFGVTAGSTTLVVAVFDASSRGDPHAVLDEVCGVIEGDRVPFAAALDLVADAGGEDRVKRLCKLYKVTQAELKVSTVEDAALTRLAIRDVAS